VLSGIELFARLYTRTNPNLSGKSIRKKAQDDVSAGISGSKRVRGKRMTPNLFGRGKLLKSNGWLVTCRFELRPFGLLVSFKQSRA